MMRKNRTIRVAAVGLFLGGLALSPRGLRAEPRPEGVPSDSLRLAFIGHAWAAGSGSYRALYSALIEEASRSDCSVDPRMLAILDSHVGTLRRVDPVRVRVASQAATQAARMGEYALARTIINVLTEGASHEWAEVTTILDGPEAGTALVRSMTRPGDREAALVGLAVGSAHLGKAAEANQALRALGSQSQVLSTARSIGEIAGARLQPSEWAAFEELLNSSDERRAFERGLVNGLASACRFEEALRKTVESRTIPGRSYLRPMLRELDASQRGADLKALQAVDADIFHLAHVDVLLERTNYVRAASARDSIQGSNIRNYATEALLTYAMDHGEWDTVPREVRRFVDAGDRPQAFLRYAITTAVSTGHTGEARGLLTHLQDPTDRDAYGYLIELREAGGTGSAERVAEIGRRYQGFEIMVYGFAQAGIALAQAGNPLGAETVLLRASGSLERLPSSRFLVRVHIAMAAAFEAAGDRDGALRHLGRALAAIEAEAGRLVEHGMWRDFAEEFARYPWLRGVLLDRNGASLDLRLHAVSRGIW